MLSSLGSPDREGRKAKEGAEEEEKRSEGERGDVGKEFEEHTLSNVSGASVEVTPTQTRTKESRNICNDIFAITCGYVSGLIPETWEYA
ncbi:hypothetical protein ROHU_019915 [Labeo rohita]|uniref:Uncharacterized protein n=1 Tax=Labeo rohita TaxID=84645 RepID=A0A498N3M2_LABRO|nr:hypothetical protein ROHU_019915 [Labeo rohita]